MRWQGCCRNCKGRPARSKYPANEARIQAGLTRGRTHVNPASPRAMSETKPHSKGPSFCNLLALEKGLDPGGHATHFESLALLEAPLPWRRDIYEKDGPMPRELLDLYELYLTRYHETGVWPASYVFLVAPDEAYSRSGHRRVILFQHDEAQFATYSRAEYLVPEAQAGKLIWAAAEEPDKLDEFNAWKVTHPQPVRDILVCTHGTVDAACAKFGFPLYRYLRHTHADEHLRVWRVSHFGGHVFAPTLMDMPAGHFWAYVGEAQADQIVRRDGDVAQLRSHYRGWAGLEYGFPQAAERAMWLREGWRWLAWPRRGQVLAQDDAASPSWAEVQIEFDDESGPCFYRCRVEMSGAIDTFHTTGEAETYPYPQYRVVRLERGDRTPDAASRIAQAL